MTEQSVIDRIKADVAAIRDDLSAANLAGDLSRTRALVNSALRKVEGVIGHLATVVSDEVEAVLPDVDERDESVEDEKDVVTPLATQ